MISHMVDWHLFGANASGHHLVSLLIHIGSVIFLFLFLNKTTNNLWPSAFAAALFALHPLRVESVAWAAERKDVLSMFFGMTALYAYVFYVESAKYSRYFICLILFALSLMTKPMLVTMPFILLLLDYWPLRRWQKTIATPVENRFKSAYSLVWEKVPFFILGALSIGVTLWAQRTGIASFDRLPIVSRSLNAILSYLNYIVKFVYPVDLAVFYPYPDTVPPWQVIIAALFLLGVSITVIYSSRKMPFLFVGWLWYLVTLIPVIGLVQVGLQAMADRYTYLPSIGIAIILAWGVPLLFRSKDTRRKILFPVASAIIVTLMFLSWMQCGYWENSINLFSHTLHVTKNNFATHNHIALTLSKEGKVNEAIYHYNEAIRINPNYTEAYNNRGTLYGKFKQYQLAMEDFNKAIRLYPNYAEAHYNKGLTYFMIGQYQNAIEYYNKVINLKSDFADAYRNRALVYFKQGNRNLGCLDAQKACELGNCKTLESAKNKGYCR